MKSKIGAALFALLFAVGFGAGGAMGIASLAGQLNGWWEARTWQAVPATVTHSELKVSQGEGTTYRAVAQYRYEVNGRTYFGDRVGLSGGSDNVGSWQRTQFERLRRAQREGTAITIWVDPDAPEHSLVDRDLRWGIVVLSLPFAILFPLIALGALWAFFRVLRMPAKSVDEPPKLEPNPPRIKSDRRYALYGWWLFAIFWGLIAFPIAFLFIDDNPGRWSLWLLVMIFPLVGLALIWIAMSRTFRFIRNGDVAIALSPAQPQLGEAFTVEASFSRVPPAGEYCFKLLCEEVDDRGDSTRSRTRWQQERVVQVNGPAAALSFLPPTGFPHSQPATGIYYRWRISMDFPGPSNERTFDVVLSPAREGTRGPEQSEPTQDDVIARPVPSGIATIIDERSRLRISYNPANSRGTAIGCGMFAIVFAGGSGLLLFNAWGLAPKLIGLVFAAIGIALLGASAYALTHRRIVEIVRDRVSVANTWLLNSKRETFAITDVKKLVPSINGTTTYGNKHYDHHQIKALLNDGRQVVLASDIRDAGVARTLMDLLGKHVGPAGDAREPFRPDIDRTPLSARVSPEQRARGRKRLKLGLQVFGTLIMGAFLWDIFGPLVSRENVRNNLELEVESSNRDEEKSMRAIDQELFNALDSPDPISAIADAITNGADLNAVNHWGATPLVVAARSGQAEVVRSLIRAGSNIDFAVAMDNEYRGRTPLMNAATGGNGATVEMLLVAGANPLVFESHGWSALHYAAHRGNIGALRAFKRHHVELDLHSPESRGETPLMIAARFGKLEAIRELISLGADPRAKDRHGENAYGWAKFFDQQPAMDVLSRYQQ